MDTATPILIAFRTAHRAGAIALQDSTKPVLKARFLQSARSALHTLYGPNVPIVQKYTNALKNLHGITQNDIAGLFIEFEHFLKWLEAISGQETINPKSQPSPPPAGRSIFIIHGHDEVNTLRLSHMFQNHFSLNPVLMKSKPGMSRALLEKFEDVAATCSMAFALITPDDQITNHQTPYYQARPNVIFEAGWFVGRLSIPRVCILLKDGATVHSDIDGISRIHFRENVEEKVIDIQRELEAVGLLYK